MNNAQWIIAECAKRESEYCKWHVRALKCNVNDFFYIKELDNNHTCKGVLREQTSSHLGSHVVKSEISNELKANPTLKPRQIMDRFKHSFGLDISYRSAWYARELRGKMSMVMMAIPILSCCGIVMPFWKAIPDPIAGFREQCKIGKWFFDHLYNILSTQGRIVTFVTDRNGGLLNAVASVFPDSPHSYCYYHLKENVRALYRNLSGYFVDKLVEEFMKVAYSPTIASYNFNLQNLKREGGKPIESFLTHLPLDKWCNAFFRGSRYGEMANSIAKSFNSWCGPLRELPVFDFLEGLRVKVMENMSEREVECKKWNTVLCPPMEALLKKFMDVGRHWSVSMSSETLLEVHAEKSVAVDLENGTCSCRQWQINSFPCSHALAAIQKVGDLPVYAYIEYFHTCQSYIEAYEHGIQPIPNIDKFYVDAATSSAVVQPPLVRRPSGQPKSVRMKSAAEGGTRRAIRCGQLGRHNKATCTTPI
ncbi:PREDICTED: uncharacterized protein LOC101299742 [Fragaria vesca subsp. vesca]